MTLQALRWGKADTVALLLVSTLAAAARLFRLREPQRLVFDEAFYARDACLYAGVDRSHCHEELLSEMHPPLAKWLISLGIRAFGYDAFGWRLVSVIAGTITVALLFLLARRLLRSTASASLASGLFAVDFLHFVQSRVAMLDVFVTLFTVAVMWFVLRERDTVLGGMSPRWLNWNRIGIGMAGGLAIASKWSGLLVLLAAGWLLLAWGSKIQPGSSAFRRLAADLKQQGVSLAVTIVLVPLAVYALSFAGGVRTPIGGPASADSWLETLVQQNRAMLADHRQSVSVHPAQSPAWTWPLIKRPIPFYVERGPEIRAVWFGGNPAVWWPALIAIGITIVRWIRKQDPHEPDGFIAAGFLLLYLPWLILTSPLVTWGRNMVFIFYLLPAVPFMYLALTHLAMQISNRRRKVAAALALIFAGYVGFGFFYPLMTSTPITRQAWLRRVGWFDNCERPPPSVLSLPIEITSGGRVTTTIEGLTLPVGNPPEGWCWK